MRPDVEGVTGRTGSPNFWLELGGRYQFNLFRCCEIEFADFSSGVI